MIILTICLIISGILVFLLFQKNGQLNQQLAVKIEKDTATQTANEHLLEVKKSLQNDIEQVNKLINDRQQSADAVLETIKKNQEISEQLDKSIAEKRNEFQSTLDNNRLITDQAFEAYCSTLEQQYNKVEQEYDSKIDTLQTDIKYYNAELDKLKQTRAAAHEALLKEQEIKDNKDDYRLKPSDSDLTDARRLALVRRELKKPRVLDMLIWQTYWQPLAKKQFPLILKDKTKCGIYKITNLITDECYVGQSVDIYKRWSDHCKCGLGIDTPPGNKLYQAMQEYGLDNFTFELLEECDASNLNEKEKYFIELYQADTFGYNSQAGNKR